MSFTEEKHRKTIKYPEINFIKECIRHFGGKPENSIIGCERRLK